MDQSEHSRRLTVASPWSGAGKTTITLALMRALVNRGIKVCPLKVGPDFIDGSFHYQACGRPSANIDLYLQDSHALHSFLPEHEQDTDLTVLEGCMGLFDGIGCTSQYSTAEVSELLDAQILLVIPAQKFGASIVALARGFIQEHPHLRFCGIVVSQSRSDRHGELLTQALYQAFPHLVCGYMNFYEELALPSRHLGLMPHRELNERAGEKSVAHFYDKGAEVLCEHFDVDKLVFNLGLPNASESTRLEDRPHAGHGSCEIASLRDGVLSRESFHGVTATPDQPIIGVAYDEAFSFYYATSLKALKDAGFQVVTVSPLHDKSLSSYLDALYIGGGYPEVFIRELSDNVSFIESLRRSVDEGMPVFAECGGYIYLQREFIDHKTEAYRLCDILPGQVSMRERLSPHFGYVSCFVQNDSWLFQEGDTLRGHEFHYAEIDMEGSELVVEKVSTGKQWVGGSAYKKLFGSFVHLDLLSHDWLVERLYDEAVSYRLSRGR